MVQIIRYLTHPEIEIDPTTPIHNWRLNFTGRERVREFLLKPNWLTGTTRVISSAEQKAIDTARPIAEALSLELEVRQDMHENDRSSTGFLPPDKFEKQADKFFAQPEQSILGWERAVDAQARIVAAVERVLADEILGHVLLVGHGAVGTLLCCHYSGNPISREFDQPPGGGNYFSFLKEGRLILHRWRKMEWS